MLALVLALLGTQAAGGGDPCRLGAERVAGGDATGALPLIERCVQRHPADLEWRLRLCALYQQVGRDRELYQTALEGLRLFPEERRFYLTAGNRAARYGETDLAVDLLSQARRRWPDDDSLRDAFAEALLVRGLERFDREEYPGAEADLRQVLELDPDHVEALLNLGRIQYNLLRREEALASFDRVRDVAPETPLVEFHRGVVLHSLNQNDLALEALNRELRRNPEHPVSYYFRGLVLKALHRCPEALADLETAGRLMPRYREVPFEAGRCLEMLGRYSEAEQAYRTSFQLDPTEPKSLFSLGQMLQRIGRAAEARAILEQARGLYVNKVREHRAEFQFQSTRSAPPQ
jgi:tetratricopeptide (TPR) repeat protein